MPPVTRYARSGDVHLAYQVVGQGPIDLVFVHGWVSNVEYGWEVPPLARFLTRLASFSRLILFDRRGTGMSDRVPDDRLPTLEQRMDDIRTVMDAAGSERAAIFGASEGGNMSVLFAATYPERTVALVTIGIFAKRIWSPEYPWAPTPEQRQRDFEIVEREWHGEMDVTHMRRAPTRRFAARSRRSFAAAPVRAPRWPCSA
jgi:pimeloyl-ACP methyl ester carboxylesterase